MGNVCKCVCRQTDDDESTDALLNGFERNMNYPRGPPPPYQVEAPFYAMSEEQRVQVVQRITMIQCLPLGRYDDGGDKKDKSCKLEESEEVQGCEKKGEKDRECPICMVDFAVGEPIRLLPCMHFYHMRCIDEWLMRSLSCPSCMERVDKGLRYTAITSPISGLRRRRRRRERGSTSSTASGGSIASGHGAEVYSKRNGDYNQYLPDCSRDMRNVSGQCEQGLGQCEQFEQGLRQAPQHSGRSGKDIGYLTAQQQLNLTGQNSGHYSGHSTITGRPIGQIEEASSGEVCDVELLDNSGFAINLLSPDHQHAYRTSFNDFPQRIEYLSSPVSPTHLPSSPEASSVHSPRHSPPLLEYHFEYPVLQADVSTQ